MGLDAQIAIVIPALNEAHTIVDLAQRALAYSRNVIVVDDGSSDGTAEVLSALPVTVLRHEATQGKGASLVAGFREALKRDVWAVATLDGDGQHRPEDLPKFLARAAQEAGPEKDQIVIGSRLAHKAEFPPARYRANRFADFWISWASGHLIEDSQSGFRLYPRQVLESVRARADRRHGFVFESEILINAARKGYGSVAVSIPALYHGATQRDSHFRPVADILRIVFMVAGKLLSRGMYPQGLYRVFRAWRDKRP
jgi:glycosyltransferase involved in cell wall biosynthesis